MVAHEYAHGYAALRQGDDTALKLGRLSWNPLRHIDPVMTVILPLLTFFTAGVAFGGAKPIPVDPRNYRNFRSGDIIVSLAGIATNLLIAVLLVPIVAGLGLLGRASPGVISDSCALLQVMFLYGIVLNLVLAAFNLMPIPPLDGSHVLKHFLPVKWAIAYQRAANWGFALLMLLVTFGTPVLNTWMKPAFLLNQAAQRTLSPYLIPSPWTN